MSDMAKTIVAKADQMNAEDFLAGAATFTVERVNVKQSADDQPVSIYMVDHDPKRPFKPCKTFRRVLVEIWGGDSKAYVGKSMTLFRNPDVMFQGEKVGGIEISHMSGLNGPRTLKLTATRGRKRTITIEPLKGSAAQSAATHPLTEPFQAMKAKWKQSRESTGEETTPEAFAEWVEATSSGSVQATDALKPSFYNAETISHLFAVLGE